MSSLSLKAAILFLLSISALYFLFTDRPISGRDRPAIELSAKCDVSKSKCDFTIPNIGGGQVDIRPRPLQSAQRFTVSVSNLTFQPEKIEVNLEQVDGPPVYNKAQLQPSTAGYIVETVFPTCTAERMSWKLTLLISASDRLYAIPWTFEVSRK